MSFLAEGQDAAAEGFFDVVVEVVRAAGTIEEGGAISFGLGQSIFPFVEAFPGDSQAQASQGNIPQSLGFLKPGIALTNLLFWRKFVGGHGLTSFLF